jgi:uncharacterized membrane protein
MFEVCAAVRIQRPLEEVFAFIAENENDPLWCIPVIETTRVLGERPSVGARYTFASKVGLIKLRGEFEIIEFEPHVHVGWQGTSPFGTYVGHYRLEAAENGAAHLEECVTFQYRGLWQALEPLHQRLFASNYDQQLDRLKLLLERSNN